MDFYEYLKPVELLFFWFLFFLNSSISGPHIPMSVPRYIVVIYWVNIIIIVIIIIIIILLFLVLTSLFLLGYVRTNVRTYPNNFSPPIYQPIRAETIEILWNPTPAFSYSSLLIGWGSHSSVVISLVFTVFVGKESCRLRIWCGLCGKR
jgi:hypothetical protein